MSGDDTPIYYWDTCMFLAWLKDESRDSEDMSGVREVIRKAEQRRAYLITSAITYAEVLSARLPAGVDEMFDDLFKRRNFSRIAVDHKIAKLAANIRSWYLERGDKYNGKTICTPDALHLATAIFHKVDEFHTFDGDGNKKDSKHLKLLKLGNEVGGHRLTICKPVAEQPEFDYGDPPKKPKQ